MKPIRYEDSTKHFHMPGTFRLTYYEFNCGYVQRVESNDCTLDSGISLTLWKEHNKFHVRAHNYATGRIFWDSFDTMTQANKRFFKAAKSLGLEIPKEEA